MISVITDIRKDSFWFYIFFQFWQMKRMKIEAAEINKGYIVEEMLKLDPLDKARTYKNLLRSSSYIG